MPRESQYVLADSPLEQGLCFLMSEKKQNYGVVFGDGRWSAFVADFPWEPCPNVQEISIAGVIMSTGQGSVKPEAYLYEPQLLEGWTLFGEHRHPLPAIVAATTKEDGTTVFAEPRLPPLKEGDRVDCLGKVWSGTGNKATAGEAVTFIAIAQQRIKKQDGSEGQWRRVAIVALPSGQLTWAELMSKDAGGLIQLSEPSASVSVDEVGAGFRAKLTALLASRDVANVDSLLRRLVSRRGEVVLRQPTLRSSSRTPTPPVVASSIDAAAPAATPAPSLPHTICIASQRASLASCLHHSCSSSVQNAICLYRQAPQTLHSSSI